MHLKFMGLQIFLRNEKHLLSVNCKILIISVRQIRFFYSQVHSNFCNNAINSFDCNELKL